MSLRHTTVPFNSVDHVYFSNYIFLKHKFDVELILLLSFDLSLDNEQSDLAGFL